MLIKQGARYLSKSASSARSGFQSAATQTTKTAAKQADEIAEAGVKTVIKEVPKKDTALWKKMLGYQIGITAATSTAGLGISALENQTDGALSKTAIDALSSTFGKDNVLQILEKGMEVNSAISQEVADAKVSALTAAARKTGKFTEEELNSDTAQKAAYMTVYVSSGDIAGVVRTASQLDIKLEDALGAYNDAIAENKGADSATLFKATFDNLNEVVEQSKQEKKAAQEQSAGKTNKGQQAEQAQKEAQAENKYRNDLAAFNAVTGAAVPAYNSMSDQQINKAFNEMAEDTGFLEGLVQSIAVEVASWFGFEREAKVYFLSQDAAEQAAEKVQDALDNGQALSRTGANLLHRREITQQQPDLALDH